jgi:putative hemolysin
MRIWDISPEKLCRQHLLGEHSELHAIWTILTRGKTGYSRHPETMRWKGKLKALYARHEALVKEMVRRGYRHNSPLSQELAKGAARQDIYVDSYDEQCNILRHKGCGCMIK